MPVERFEIKYLFLSDSCKLSKQYGDYEANELNFNSENFTIRAK